MIGRTYVMSAALVAGLSGCISDWRGDVTVCPVHHESMSWETRPIGYGLPDDKEFARMRVAKMEFPFANTRVMGGCMQGPDVLAMVRYCLSCRAAEARWIEANMPQKPEVISPAYSTAR